MASVLIRNLSDSTHNAIKSQARAAGRSTEAEIRLILDAAVQPKNPVRLGTKSAVWNWKMSAINQQISK